MAVVMMGTLKQALATPRNKPYDIQRCQTSEITPVRRAPMAKVATPTRMTLRAP